MQSLKKSKGGQKVKIKRKFGNRANWRRVKERKYKQSYIQTADYRGYVSLLTIEKAASPLWTSGGLKEVCVLDDGYSWLQHFPQDQHHSVTTVFDRNGQIVQWYVDICLRNGVENNIPFLDDLFLDVILFPSGLVIEKDKDEIEEALELGIISKDMYALAWREFNAILDQIKNGEFLYKELASVHKEALLNQRKQIPVLKQHENL